MDMAVTQRQGRIVLQPSRRRLFVDGQPVKIGARAFDLLNVLIERRDRVVTKDELLELVWPGVVVEEANLHVQIGGLRKLVGADAIATVAGRGYRFVAPDAVPPVVEGAATQATRRRDGAEWRWKAAIAATCVTLALVGFAAARALWAQADAPVFAAVPFVAEGDDALSAQLAAGVTTDLARTHSLQIIAASVASAYARSRPDPQHIARDLRADYVLMGTARRDGDTVEISATLSDGAAGDPVWSNRWRASVGDDLIAFQAGAAADVAAMLDGRAFLLVRTYLPGRSVTK